MIVLDRVTVTYPGAAAPVLEGVDLRVEEGELCLVTGRTGAGKSTLLGLVNGLVPHFTGGQLRGRVTVAGVDTRHHPPRELAHLVGVVGQDPLAGFVTDTVEEELAYAMEQLAIAPEVMRKRVEETLDLLGIAELRARPLRTLSGGQQQRVAIGAALTAHPRVLVLDEPTSALDPTAAEEVLAAITRLVHDLGVTVLAAEHRLERVVQYADRMVLLTPGRVVAGEPAVVLAGSPVAPPVVELGRLAGWTPLPLSVRDARRHAAGLRDRLAASQAGTPPPAATQAGAAPAPATTQAGTTTTPAGTPTPATQASTPTPAASQADAPTPAAAQAGTPTPAASQAGTHTNAMGVTGALIGQPALSARKVVVRYGQLVAVAGVDLTLQRGEVTALMGRNGSGKSSLLWALQGAGSRQGGRVEVAGEDTAALPAHRARQRVGLVPQTPADLLYLPTVAAECAQADRESAAAPGSCRALLDRFVPGVPDDRHPADLSEGQRLALVLAIQLVAAPPVVLLDEPTRGLDYPAKRRFTELVRLLATDSRSVVVATHDVELVAATADRVVVLADGEIVADGPTGEVVVASPAFAPQVAKVLATGEPGAAAQPWLTVAQVAAALDRSGP